MARYRFDVADIIEEIEADKGSPVEIQHIELDGDRLVIDAVPR